MQDADLKERKDSSEEIIDVVAEFDYSTQSDEYNNSFKKWRKTKSNPFAYNFVSNKKEKTFVDGHGFTTTKPEDSEREVIYRILYVFGMALLAYIFFENIFGKIFIIIMDTLGFNIHNSFANNSMYGGMKEMTITLITINTIKYLVPIAFIHHRLKMPANVAFPARLKSTGELLYSISAAMILSVVTSISRAYSDHSREIYDYFNAYDADVSFFSQRELIIYTVFDVLIVSILSEILFRGEILHALRQFGDLFAIIVSAFFSSIIMQDFRLMPATFLIAVIAGISVLRSGTIFSAISIRIIHSVYLLALTLIESDSSEYMFLTRSFYMSVVFATGVIVFLVVTSIMKKRVTILSNYHTYLPMKNKLLMCCQCIALIGVFASCCILAFTDLII